MTALPLRFDHPGFLLLALLAIPLIVIGWRTLAPAMDGLRRSVILGLRTALLLALAVMLAGPKLQKEHDHITVIGLLDISRSVQRFGGMSLDSLAKIPDSDPTNQQPAAGDGTKQPASIIEHLRDWFRAATQIKASDDRFGLVVFDGRAIAVSAPTRADYVDDNLDVSIAQGTNIEEAVRLGLAMFPPDTAKRLVLVTDGNETAGNVMEAVKRLGGVNRSGPIPIDVLPITYRVDRDVQVVRLEAPPSAQPGQTVTVRIIVEATAPTAGTLTLRREGEPVDLNTGAPQPHGPGRHVNLPAGQSVHLAQVVLGQNPINRFDAIFEADHPGDNVLSDNDRAEAFTATPSAGSALVLDSFAGQRENGLAQILNAAAIPTAVQRPAQLPDDLLSLQNYNLIVLDNVAAWELSPHQQEMLTKYVNDLGGGLIMTGGENSFGAGGWKGSPVAAILPIELDPSKQLRLPTAALVLVLDKSGSMNQPVAGARASQQQVANEGAALAIQSLRQDNLVGVITFDLFASTLIPLQRNDDPKKLADIVRSITADGGTNLEAPLSKAYDMLKNVEVARKRVVFMTDGRAGSNDGLEDLVRQMAAANIQLTTIAVGDDADYDILEKLAKVGGGEFYPVRDPRILPRVLMDSVQIINKPLIKEVAFTPRVLPTGSTLTAGMQSAPPLAGLVITSARNDPKATLEMVDPDGEPLLAHWQAGLGRVAAFTSTAPGSGQPATSGSGGDWAREWINWPTAATFWTQLARLTARPAMDQDAELTVGIQDDRLHILLEVSDDPNAQPSADHQTASASVFSTPLQVEGTVYRPDGTTMPVRLRQSAPGRFEAAAPAELAGNYIVALNPRQGVRRLAPAISGAYHSSNPEFRRFVSNLPLLNQIVEQTGGRRLNLGNPLQVNLFDRSTMPRSISLLPAWRTILWWALALLLLDVASRRIAWSSQQLRAWAAHALARVKPARVRGAEAAATLATLRQVSEERRVEPWQQPLDSPISREDLQQNATIHDSTFDPAELNLAAPRPLNEERSLPSHTGQTRKAEPEPSKVAAAIDAFLGRAPTQKPPDGPAAPAPDPAKDASETTGSLLAAKRRARQRLQNSGEHDG